ncbi:MAG: hypothetical protein A4E35_01090 [Methanoregula sp. PtaU1.Bin051]|nr:MAG: hypothetical protein A4E35_01090 [Methanoregula sp. PtaU1.Bin051]
MKHFEVIVLRHTRKSVGDDAVSPVVGVMLMLVVTIIIAAVVSAFAGGMGKTTEKAPSATLKVNIVNDGTWGGSHFHVDVLGVSEPIPTKDIKIVTSWRNASGISGGSVVTGPNTTGSPNTHTSSTASWPYHSPLGFGPGVPSAWNSSGKYALEQMWGNYSLMANTRLHNSAYGYSSSYGGYGVTPQTRFTYTDGTAYVYGTDWDAMQAILGYNWNILRPGDIVNVKFVHIPTGRIIYDGKVPVEGSSV